MQFVAIKRSLPESSVVNLFANVVEYDNLSYDYQVLLMSNYVKRFITVYREISTTIYR